MAEEICEEDFKLEARVSIDGYLACQCLIMNQQPTNMVMSALFDSYRQETIPSILNIMTRHGITLYKFLQGVTKENRVPTLSMLNYLTDNLKVDNTIIIQWLRKSNQGTLLVYLQNYHSQLSIQTLFELTSLCLSYEVNPELIKEYYLRLPQKDLVNLGLVNR